MDPVGWYVGLFMFALLGIQAVGMRRDLENIKREREHVRRMLIKYRARR